MLALSLEMVQLKKLGSMARARALSLSRGILNLLNDLRRRRRSSSSLPRAT